MYSWQLSWSSYPLHVIVIFRNRNFLFSLITIHRINEYVSFHSCQVPLNLPYKNIQFRATSLCPSSSGGHLKITSDNWGNGHSLGKQIIKTKDRLRAKTKDFPGPFISETEKCQSKLMFDRNRKRRAERWNGSIQDVMKETRRHGKRKKNKKFSNTNKLGYLLYFGISTLC